MEKVDRVDTEIDMICPYCGTMNSWDVKGLEAQGILLPFCKDGDCEELDAARM